MWEVNPKNKKIIGLGRGFLQLIHGVIIYLIALHEQNDFNSNLLENMRISGKNVVSSSYWDLEFKINSLKGIVANVHHLTSMKIAYFNYSHPFFFNDVNMMHFIYKVYEVRKRNVGEFNFKPNMSPCHDKQSLLLQVLYYHQGRHPYAFRNYFNCPIEVVPYLRTVCEHGRDINPKELPGRILKELHQVLPDALSKIHFLLHVKFDDYICRKHFNNNNIVELMTNDHFGYKGSFESIVQITRKRFTSNE
ncbi:hypothetical protein CsSME_00029398 [Camellia sinensis var. sinensis]